MVFLKHVDDLTPGDIIIDSYIGEEMLMFVGKTNERYLWLTSSGSIHSQLMDHFAFYAKRFVRI